MLTSTKVQLHVRRRTLHDRNPASKGMASHDTKVSRDLSKYFLSKQIRALSMTHISRVTFLSNTHMMVISEARSYPSADRGNMHSAPRSQKPANTSRSPLC